MSHLTGFNNLFDKFLSDLSRWNPDISDIQVLQTSIQLLRQINPRAVLMQFMFYISPYYVHILNENEAFFVDLNNIKIDVVPDDFKDCSDAELMQKLISFKDKWGTYTEERKARIWKMLKALVKIGALASNDPKDKIILEYIAANPSVF